MTLTAAPIPVSVVVVSRNRPTWLRRCLIALDQQDYPLFEIIVVACPAGADVARKTRFLHRVIVQEFDEANISIARNIGVQTANGDVVAFIDDDAAAEPTWLLHLASAFANPDVIQAGGTTLGRNGISTQSAAALVTPDGRTHPIAAHSGDVQMVLPTGSALPRLHGTNMALRRDAVVQHRGFDPRFAFYLDETDLSFRIAKAGGITAFVPKAVVHHAFAQSVFRNTRRTPLRLFEIGVSTGVFHQKHLGDTCNQTARHEVIAERRAWLLEHMISGTLTPDDVIALLQELEQGYDDGFSRKEVPHSPRPHRRDTLGVPASDANPQDYYLVARPGTERVFQKQARDMVSAGHRVTVFSLSLTSLYHRVVFTTDGYWLHTGGIFGREYRDEPLFQKSTRDVRIGKILKRLTGIRSRRALQCKN